MQWIGGGNSGYAVVRVDVLWLFFVRNIGKQC